MQIEFNTSGPKRLLADISEAGPRNELRLRGTVRDALHGIESDAKIFAPFRTGALREGIHARARGLTGEVVSEEPYSEYVEEGTSDTAPRPFMRPATDRRLPGFQRSVLDVGADIL